MPRPLVDQPVLRVGTLPAASACAGEFRRTSAGLFWSDGADWIGPLGAADEPRPAFVAITQADYDNLNPPDAGTLYLIVAGPATGQGREWIALTEQEYDELDPPDPNTLYIVVPE